MLHNYGSSESLADRETVKFREYTLPDFCILIFHQKNQVFYIDRQYEPAWEFQLA